MQVDDEAAAAVKIEAADVEADDQEATVAEGAVPSLAEALDEAAVEETRAEQPEVGAEGDIEGSPDASGREDGACSFIGLDQCLPSGRSADRHL
jgi:hypothetical protein